ASRVYTDFRQPSGGAQFLGAPASRRPVTRHYPPDESSIGRLIPGNSNVATARSWSPRETKASRLLAGRGKPGRNQNDRQRQAATARRPSRTGKGNAYMETG